MSSFEIAIVGTALPDDVEVGLDLLARSEPLWSVGLASWSALVERVEAFAWDWDGRARAAGWSTLQLYGVHGRAPGANLATMGVAWVVARSELRVVAVDADGVIHVRSYTGAAQRVSRWPAEPQAVAAWVLCEPVANDRKRTAVKL